LGDSVDSINKTYTPKAGEIQRAWRVIDATEKPLGRLASEVAQILRGKNKPSFATHMDVGDYVVVVNAARVGITGKNKPIQKMYYRHSGYLGSLRAVSLQKMMDTRPERVIEHAVRGMLPKNSLGRSMFRKLRVYSGPTHPHGGQVSASGASETND
jgi:large subunit ribosomal protein L13